MKHINSSLRKAAELYFFGSICAVFAVQSSSAQTTSSAIQLPDTQLAAPVLRSPTMGFQERRAMLPETAAHHADLVTKILKAVSQNDHPAFVWRGTDKFQKAERGEFEGLVSRWSERLKDGFKSTPIGELRKNSATSLWRVQFVAGGDEALVVLTTDKRGNIVSFQLI